MMPYERLEAWQSCHALCLETYHVTASFPKSELCGLTSQMRRAAFSAPANLAEGSAKRGAREFRRYIDSCLIHRSDHLPTFRPSNLASTSEVVSGVL